MNRDLARQSFEAWYNAEYIRPIIPADRTEGGYQHPDAQSAWDAWQAAISHAKGEAVGEITIDKHGDAHFRASLGYLDLDQGTYELYTHPAPQVAVPEKVRELIGAVRSVNRSRQHSIHIEGDDEPCFWQRAEWVRYVLELADEAEQTITAAPTAPAGEPVVFPEPQEATTIEEYVGEYEYTDGEGHNYSPTETERALILDAIHGIPDHLLQPPKPAQQPVSDSDGSSNSSRALLDQIIEQLEGGFVACSSCGDQEDTATLDVMDDLRRLRFLLADAGNRAAPAPDERGIAERTCEWSTDDEWDDDNWESECGASWTFPDGGPAENGMKFRPKCGAKIRLRAGKGDE